MRDEKGSGLTFDPVERIPQQRAMAKRKKTKQNKNEERCRLRLHISSSGSCRISQDPPGFSLQDASNIPPGFVEFLLEVSRGGLRNISSIIDQDRSGSFRILFDYCCETLRILCGSLLYRMFRDFQDFFFRILPGFFHSWSKISGLMIRVFRIVVVLSHFTFRILSGSPRIFFLPFQIDSSSETYDPENRFLILKILAISLAFKERIPQGILQYFFVRVCGGWKEGREGGREGGRRRSLKQILTGIIKREKKRNAGSATRKSQIFTQKESARQRKDR